MKLLFKIINYDNDEIKEYLDDILEIKNNKKRFRNKIKNLKNKFRDKLGFISSNSLK